MKSQPHVGDRVRVPWGLSSLVGTVVEAYAGGRFATVEIPVEGSSGEVLETERVSFPVDALEEVRPWRIVRTSAGRPKAVSGEMSWYVDIERDDERRRIEVSVAEGLSDRRGQGRQIPAHVELVFQTKGRSAVGAYLEEDDPPSVLVVGAHGIAWLP